MREELGRKNEKKKRIIHISGTGKGGGEGGVGGWETQGGESVPKFKYKVRVSVVILKKEKEEDQSNNKSFEVLHQPKHVRVKQNQKNMPRSGDFFFYGKHTQKRKKQNKK